MKKTAILIVEDEAIVAQDIQHSLEEEGYLVSGITTTGEECIEAIRRSMPDLVLMDIKLSGAMDGIEAANLINREFQLPVVFLTAYADKSTLKKAKIAEPCGYIVKPVNNRELYSTIEICLYRYDLKRQLQRSEKKYRELVESIPLAIYVLNYEWRYLLVNEAACVFSMKSREALTGNRIIDVFPGIENSSFFKIYRRVMDDREADTLVSEFVFEDGRRGWYEVRVIPVPEGIICIAGDITERRNAEESLRASEERYRGIVEHLPILICRFLPETANITFVNKRYCEYFNKPFDELMGRSFLDLVPAEEHKKIMEHFSSLNKDNPFVEYEHVVNSPQGRRWQKWIDQAIFDEGGNVIEFQSIGEDITQRKSMEEERERLVNDLAKRVRELDCLYSLSELVVQHGVNAEEALLRIASMLTRSWQYPDIACSRIIIEDREYKTDNFKRTEWCQFSDIFVFGGKAGSVEVCYLEKMPDFFEGPFLKEERDLIDAVAERLGRIIERDTAVFELQHSREELQNLYVHLQTVREEERTSVAREIHDELGQAMTALKMDISWIKNKICGQDKEIIKKLDSVSGLVDNTVNTIREISSRLRPVVIDDLGLNAAIEWQTGVIEERTGISCKVELPSEERVLSDEHKIIIFRVFQEAMTNIVRHAKATEVSISLRHKDNSLVMTIIDNGIGITEEQLKNPASFGIIGMKERVSFCNGTIIIEGIESEGTMVKVTVPLEGH